MHGYKSSVLCIQLCTSLCQQLLRCHHRILPPHLPCLLTLLAWITQLIPSSPLSLNATVKNALSLPFTGIAGFVFGSCLVTLSPSFCWASWDTEQKCWCCLTLHSRGTCQIKCCVSSGVWMQTYRKADESVLECYGESRSGLKWGFFFLTNVVWEMRKRGYHFSASLSAKEEVYFELNVGRLSFPFCLISILAAGRPAFRVAGLSVHSSSALRIWAPVAPVRGAHSYRAQWSRLSRKVFHPRCLIGIIFSIYLLHP